MVLDKFRLDGEVAVVTGGTRGLGKAMSLALAEAGADIALVSRNANSEVEEHIRALGRRCVHYAADLTDRAATTRVVPDLADRMGDVNILVNNAGVIQREEIVEFPESKWDQTVEINLTAAFLLSQAAGRLMLDKGRGKIINVASVLSFQGGLFVPAYAATKHALLGLTRSCSNAWAGRGINVNAVAPGYFETDATEALCKDPERSAALLARVPAGRWGQPEDLGGTIVFLASSASDFLHGSVVNVDGGWMGW
ncbi:MAG: SDR family oxidoreductase [Deltaproteobacteria bacterium]